LISNISALVAEQWHFYNKRTCLSARTVCTNNTHGLYSGHKGIETADGRIIVPGKGCKKKVIHFEVQQTL